MLAARLSELLLASIASVGLQSGPDSSSGKALGHGLDGPGSIPASSILLVQTGPGVHSASSKCAPGVNTAEGRASNLTSS